MYEYKLINPDGLIYVTGEMAMLDLLLKDMEEFLKELPRKEAGYKIEISWHFSEDTTKAH